MRTEQEILSGVETAIVTVLKAKSEAISPSSALVDDLGAESIDFLDIGSELEKQFNVEMEFKDIIRERREKAGTSGTDLTVQDIVDHLKTLLH